jgi:hypothetical protein
MEILILFVIILSIVKVAIGFFVYVFFLKVSFEESVRPILIGATLSLLFLLLVILFALRDVPTTNSGMGSEREWASLGIALQLIIFSPLYLLFFSALDGYFLSNLKKEKNLSTLASISFGFLINFSSLILPIVGFIVYGQ